MHAQIAENPQLRALGPQARNIMMSPMFRNLITNPEAMRRAAQMARSMGMPGPGDAFGMGGGTQAGAQPGLFGLAQQQQAHVAGNLFGGLGGQPPSSTAPPSTMGTGGTPPDPLMNQNMQHLMEFLGGGAGGGMGAFGGDLFGTPATQGGNAAGFRADHRPPEVRFEAQLAQMREMGFTNATQNVRALLATGGNGPRALLSSLCLRIFRG